MWRSKYDMAPDEFTKELDRLWDQVRPLYVKLHAYVRMKLREKYGDAVRRNGPIHAPARHLWRRTGRTLSVVKPANADAGFSLTDILKKRKMRRSTWSAPASASTPRRASTPLPRPSSTLAFVRPKDRDVVCHAARGTRLRERIRIKCASSRRRRISPPSPRARPHFYQRAYSTQAGAVPRQRQRGFHEAIGDNHRLSVRRSIWSRSASSTRRRTPRATIGLLDEQGAEKISFLPSACYRSVALEGFAGEITPAEYNRVVGFEAEIPGASRRRPRGEGSSMPAPSTTCRQHPYTRYSCRHLQFQFHRGLAKTAGCTLPLNRCSIFETRRPANASERC